MADLSDYTNLLKLGVDMRVAQKAYFKSRTPDRLAASKALEKRFDDEAKRLGIQPSEEPGGLFR